MANPTKTSRPSDARTGFTLLELVLVLAVLVVLAGLMMPALEKPFAGERLKKGAEQVRTEWTRARIKAMSSGVPQVFTFQPESGWFVVEPYGGLEVETEAADASAFGLPANNNAAVSSTGPVVVPLQQRELPEGVVFVLGQALADTRSMTMGPTQPQQNPQTATSPPVFFYPDGTTSTAELLLRNEHGLHISVALRGLTGLTTISDVLAAEEVSQ